MDYKARDMEAIIAYMKGKECVKVQDIIDCAGVETLRVYPILFEMEQEGKIEVLKREKMGAAEEVFLITND